MEGIYFMPKLQTENTVQSFEDILENRGQTRLFKVVTLGHELDNQEAEFLITATEKYLSTHKNDIDENL
jgi:hypothetical protein